MPGMAWARCGGGVRVDLNHGRSLQNLGAFPQTHVFTFVRFQANPRVLEIKEEREEAASC